MTLFGLFRRSQVPSSAQIAKDRLQVLLAHERQDRARPDYLPQLQKDIVEAVRKHVQAASEKIDVRLRGGEQLSTLEIRIEIELPGRQALKGRKAPVATPSAAFAR